MEPLISNNLSDNPLVSIVVPVYNVEAYLNRCLDSIINQTYRNVEIILVNDGSTDSSPSIINDYARKDDRINVINKPNGGLASARNAGVKQAIGQYIWHIDSDDYAETQCLEKMIKKAIETDCDILVCGHNNYPDDRKPDFFFYSSPKFDNTISGYKALCLMLCTNIGGDVWSKLYKRSLYTQNDIVQKEEFSACEDWLINYQLFSKAKTVSPLNITTTNHIYRNLSLSSQAKQKNRNFLVAHHLGYLYMANYGFPTDDIKNAYYGCVGSDFLRCYKCRDSMLLKKLNITSIHDYKKYLQYLPGYSFVKDKDVKLSFKRRYIYSVFRFRIISYIVAYLLKLYSFTFK